MINILVIEDDVSIREIINYNLSNKFSVLTADNAEEGIEICEEKKIDLILLDWMLPGMSGLSFLKTIRKKDLTASIPVIFITAKNEEEDKLAGFNSGADDYLSKPFSHKELMVRVEAVLKRSYPNLYFDKVTYDNIELRVKSHKVYRDGKLISLSPKEYDILVLFMTNPKLVFSREQLLDKVWGLESDIEIRTVDVHIRRLRKAINIGNCRQIIRTVRSTGYSLD
jgi:two-component system phosphate regulon response regulator PhoB